MGILYILHNDTHLEILHMRLSLGLSHTDKYLQLFWIYNEEFDLMVLYKFMQSNLLIIKQLKHISFLVGVPSYAL